MKLRYFVLCEEAQKLILTIEITEIYQRKQRNNGMKEKDLYIDNKTQEMILFAEKDDETYGPIICGSYAVKHHLGEFILMKENLDKSLRQELQIRKDQPGVLLYVDAGYGPRRPG